MATYLLVYRPTTSVVMTTDLIHLMILIRHHYSISLNNKVFKWLVLCETKMNCRVQTEQKHPIIMLLFQASSAPTHILSFSQVSTTLLRNVARQSRPFIFSVPLLFRVYVLSFYIPVLFLSLTSPSEKHSSNCHASIAPIAHSDGVEGDIALGGNSSIYRPERCSLGRSTSTPTLTLPNREVLY